MHFLLAILAFAVYAINEGILSFDEIRNYVEGYVYYYFRQLTTFERTQAGTKVFIPSLLTYLTRNNDMQIDLMCDLLNGAHDKGGGYAFEALSLVSST